MLWGRKRESENASMKQKQETVGTQAEAGGDGEKKVAGKMGRRSRRVMQKQQSTGFMENKARENEGEMKIQMTVENGGKLLMSGSSM